MKRVLLVIVFSAITLLGFSQHPRKAVKAFEAAEKAFRERDYEMAYQQVRKAVEKDPDYAEAWLLQGEIGMETHNDEMALEGYEQSLRADSTLFPPAKTILARLQARKAFREEAMAHPVDFNPINLGNSVNTANDEYINALEITGMELLLTRKYSGDSDCFQKEALYMALAVEGQWFPASQLHLSDEMDDHMGAAFLSQKGDELYFTVCGMDRHHPGCDLFGSHRDADGTWSSPVNMGQPVNTSAWESQPCLSLDGKELFFASKRNGNADLYHCFRDENGQWSKPENLGPTINTEGTEMAPFIHPDGKTLYFSSDTHMGMGGYDLFVSRRNEKGEWSEPKNLGYPINTSGDEINFIVAADGHTALISSIREGGYGGYDIYTFQLDDEELKPESINVYDYVAEDLKPGTVVQLVNIQFEFNSSALTENSEEGVAMLADFLESHPEISVELAGHTDNIGSNTYNLKLSQERAEVVRQALIDKGIAESRLTAKGYGATKPIYSNDTDEHRALNRRTEMIIMN
ncbi:MAG: OmpA family protein [Bacteroidales bacterium]|nr:OmpA family protein [Bacteroidales bacterium]